MQTVVQRRFASPPFKDALPIGNVELEGNDACSGVWADHVDAYDSQFESFLELD